MKTNISLEQLNQLLTGDQEAFTHFYYEYREMLYQKAYKYLKKHEETEDVVQEAYTRIYLNLHKYNFTCKLSTWMIHIVKNLCIDRIRRMKVRPSVSLDDQIVGDGFTLLEMVKDDGKSPDQLIFDREESKHVIHLVRSLPVSYQKVIYLRFFSEYSYKRIADNLSLEVRTVKARLHRGKQYLKKLYNEQAS